MNATLTPPKKSVRSEDYISGLIDAAFETWSDLNVAVNTDLRIEYEVFPGASSNKVVFTYNDLTDENDHEPDPAKQKDTPRLTDGFTILDSESVGKAMQYVYEFLDHVH